MRHCTFGIFVIALAAGLVACESSTVISSADPAATGGSHTAAAHTMRHQPGHVPQLVAVMHSTEGSSAQGVITFTQTPQGVRVVADITGLSPNGRHAIHVHQYGDARAADGTSAGGHYNPEGHDHGLPEQTHRHAGDLGNLIADYNGTAHYEITVDNITLDGEHNPIIGRGVIIHAKADDGGQPVGNAGARIAIGVIGVAKP
jgi:Cu-Zn family superoxide dismutase